MREPPPTSWHTEKTATNEPGYWVLAHQAPPPKLTGQRQRKGKTPPLRSSLASDYDVDKRLITRRTSTASRSCSPTATLTVPSRTRVPSWRGARRPRGIERETRVANVSSFTLFKDS